MIFTPRNFEPVLELVRNRTAWSERWKEGCADWATEKAKECLRAGLRQLTHGKCAYCESRLEVDSFLEIDHYVAKTIDPELVFEWTNLFPTCCSSW